MTGALSRRASDVYDALESADREVAEQIFLRLVTVSEDAGDVRHRVRRSEMHFLGGDVGAVDRVLDAFGTARLLTVDRDPVTRGPTVEIAHEALLREWDTYRMWIDDRREDLLIRRRLLQALEEWLEAGRDVDHLPTRGRLTQFEEWADTTSLRLSDHEREFLDAATTRRDVERSDRRKRRQRITAGFAAAAVIASVLAVAAWVQRGVATTEASLATARALILEAEKNVDVDPELGMLLALEAIDSFEGAGEVPASATNVLRRGIEADRVIVRMPGGEFLWVAPDGSTLATASESGDGVAIRDIETGELLETVAFGDGDPVPFLFMGTNELFFEFEHAGLRVSRSLNTTTLVWEDLPGAVPTSVQSWWIDVSASGDLVAVQQDETLQVWDRHTGQVLNTLPTSTAGGLRFLDETTLVHIPSEDGDSIDLAIIDVITGETLHSAGGLSFPPLLFSLSPDGRRLATADGSFLVAMIDLETGEETWVSDGTDRAFVPLWLHGGNELLVGGEDLLKVIDADTGDLLRQITGHEGGTWAYSLIAGSDLVASSGKDDNQTLILDVSGAGPPEAARFVTPVLDTFLVSNDGTKLLLGTPSLLVVDAMSGDMVSEQDGPVFREDSGEWVPAVSPGGLFRAGETTAEASYMWSEQDQAVVYTAPDGWWVHGISPDGAHAVISKDLEPTALVRTSDRSTIAELETGGRGIVTGHFSPDGTMILTNNNSGGPDAPTFRIWNVSDGRLMGGFGSDTDGFQAWWSTFTPDSSRIILGTYTGRMFVLDVSELSAGSTGTDATILEIAAHDNLIISGAVSPDGSIIATSAWNEPAKLWDAVDGSPMGEFGSTDPNEVAFHPTEPWLYVWDWEQRTISVHTLDIDELVALARDHLSRNLTDEECLQYLLRDCDPSA